MTDKAKDWIQFTSVCFALFVAGVAFELITNWIFRCL